MLIPSKSCQKNIGEFIKFTEFQGKKGTSPESLYDLPLKSVLAPYPEALARTSAQLPLYPHRPACVRTSVSMN